MIAPDALRNAGIDPASWEMLLRSAVESLRGTASASTTSKYEFLEVILEYGRERGEIAHWACIGSSGRQDYRITLPDDTQVALEAKGCPDGNNSTIWDRPSWADEFIVWFMCPQSLAHPAGEGLWSGISTRLLPKIAAERQVVDGVVFFDGRCGSSLRPCPKPYGVSGLRSRATSIDGAPDHEDFLPAPCIYLMPKSFPTIPSNPRPPVHTLAQSKMARTLLNLFNVPAEEQDACVHEAMIEAENREDGVFIRTSVLSRCHPDGADRLYESRFKRLRRE